MARDFALNFLEGFSYSVKVALIADVLACLQILRLKFSAHLNVALLGTKCALIFR